ncbi:hypothetical protein [Ferrovibrio sp.]|uniref:hypothetical protein n=1 Tax=Ferrovibrio sp. TaxID=1917215 RepID=UPI000CCA64D3|nr:hypothetical protein [Ferrovibrio sp.]PJI39462.1 MAG: hypothetical protein CTR53_12940 [Ferrovibrio sp.]
MSDLGPLVPKPAVTSTGGSTPVTSTPAPTAPAPAPGGNAPAPAQQAPSSPTVVLQDDAADIAASARELARGGQISAQVVARDNAALLVRTAAGNTLALTSLAQAFEQANLATLNAAIRLQLNPANPQQATSLSVIVLSVNGTTLALPMPAQAQPPTAAQLALAASPPQPAASTAAPTLPQAGQTLRAVLVTPSPNSAAIALPAGSQVQVTVQAVTLPNAAPAAAALPGQPAVSTGLPSAAGAPPQMPAAATPQVTTPSAPVPALPGQSAAPAMMQPAVPQPAASPTIQAPATPPAPTPAQPAGLPQAAAASPVPTLAAPAAAVISVPITGIVTGQSQTGQVLVSTPQGVLALNLPQPLPPGTQLALELGAITRPPATAPTQLTPAPLAGVLTRLHDGWPSLQLTLDAIRAADPALAQRLQTELLPQPNARLASTALQFIAAAAVGNAQAWLGSEAVRKLEQSGRGDLLKKLDDDFRELGRLNQRQGDNDWQALVMPMMIGGKVEPIQIFMRRRKDPKKQQKQTRFIIDFNLESTGPIQFDGFVGTKQLDLILRSETEFGPAFRLDVTGIFEQALAITGMVGSLRFHDREKPLPWPSPELDSRGPSTEVKA